MKVIKRFEKMCKKHPVVTSYCFICDITPQPRQRELWKRYSMFKDSYRSRGWMSRWARLFNSI